MAKFPQCMQYFFVDHALGVEVDVVRSDDRGQVSP